jgi:hypothetical protein
MNQLRTFITAVVLLSLFSLQAVSQSCETSATTSAGTTVTFLGVTYSQGNNGCLSTWTYEVSGSDDDGAKAISHVLFGQENCLDCLNDEADVVDATVNTIEDPLIEIGQDGSTPYCGIKFDDGWEEGETRILSFTLNGAYNTGTITFVAKAGPGFTTAEVCGPECAAPVCEAGTWDPITCSCIEECVCTPPANVTVTEIGNNQIKVCWDAQECASGYVLEYQWKGHQDWNIIEIPSTDNCGIIDLNGHVKVSIRVKTICDDGSETDYSETILYGYAAPCTPPSNLSVSEITSTSAKLNWTPGTTTGVQKVQYAQIGFPNTSVRLDAGIDNYTLTNLLPSTLYKFKVKGDCWSSGKQFTTAAQKQGELLPEGGANTRVSAYPNPASSSIYLDVRLNNTLDQQVNIQLVNAFGQVLLAESKTISGGQTVVAINLPQSLNNGIYVVRVIAGQEILESKIIIDHSK